MLVWNGRRRPNRHLRVRRGMAKQLFRLKVALLSTILVVALYIGYRVWSQYFTSVPGSAVGQPAPVTAYPSSSPAAPSATCTTSLNPEDSRPCTPTDPLVDVSHRLNITCHELYTAITALAAEKALGQWDSALEHSPSHTTANATPGLSDDISQLFIPSDPLVHVSDNVNTTSNIGSYIRDTDIAERELAMLVSKPVDEGRWCKRETGIVPSTRLGAVSADALS